MTTPASSCLITEIGMRSAMDVFKTKYHSVEELLLCAGFWTDSFVFFLACILV